MTKLFDRPNIFFFVLLFFWTLPSKQRTDFIGATYKLPTILESLYIRIKLYYALQRLDGKWPYYQPMGFSKHFNSQCYLAIIKTLCTTKSVICGIFSVKNVKIIFTLKQICFSYPDQTAVPFKHDSCILFAVSDHLESLFAIVTKILTAGRLKDQCFGLYG